MQSFFHNTNLQSITGSISRGFHDVQVAVQVAVHELITEPDAAATAAPRSDNDNDNDNDNNSEGTSTPEFSRDDVIQAEEAERIRRLDSSLIRQNGLANAKSLSNLLEAAEFPKLGLDAGFKRYTRSIEEQERRRRESNHDECQARRSSAKTIAFMVRSLGWPLVCGEGAVYVEPHAGLHSEEHQQSLRTDDASMGTLAQTQCKTVAGAFALSSIVLLPTKKSGARRLTRELEEQERSRRTADRLGKFTAIQNAWFESEVIAELGFPGYVQATPRGVDWARLLTVGSPDSSLIATREEIDQNMSRLTRAISQQISLLATKSAEEVERTRRQYDAQGQQLAQQTASRVSLDIEGHMKDIDAREEEERERRMTSPQSTAIANAKNVARIIEVARAAQPNAGVQHQPDAGEILACKARAKVVSDVILQARADFELARGSSIATPQSTVLSPPVPSQSSAPLAPTEPAPSLELSQSVAPPALSQPVQQIQPVVSLSAVAPLGFVAPTAVTRSYSTLGSLSPTIFPLRRSTPISSQLQNPPVSSSCPRPIGTLSLSGNEIPAPDVTPPRVVIISDPARSLSSLNSNNNAPTVAPALTLSRSSSSAKIVTEPPKSFAPNPLSRSVSTHELDYLKREAAKYEKKSLKETQKAEKLMQKAEKLTAKGKAKQAKKKQDAAFELRQDALKHEQSANRNKLGLVLLAPAAQPTM